MAVIEKIDRFIKELNSNTKIALLHDADPDGVCSAVIFAKAIERLRNKKINYIIKQKHNDIAISDETIKKLKQLKPDWLVITDKSVDTNPKSVKEAEKYCCLLIFDHHKILADLNSERTIFAKSHYFGLKIDPSYYPTTKLVYDTFSKYTDLTDLDWIAAVGIIADYAQKEWKDFLNKVFEKYKVEKGSNYFDTPIGKVSALIASADAYGKPEDAFEILYNTKSYQEMHKSKLKEYQMTVQKEIDRILDEFDSKAEKYDDFYYYEINSPYLLNSRISTIVSMKEPNKTFIVLQREGDYYTISTRRQDKKIALNELLAKAVEGLTNASGGGHVAAAGGKFLAKDMDIVKKRIIEMLS